MVIVIPSSYSESLSDDELPAMSDRHFVIGHPTHPTELLLGFAWLLVVTVAGERLASVLHLATSAATLLA